MFPFIYKYVRQIPKKYPKVKKRMKKAYFLLIHSNFAERNEHIVDWRKILLLCRIVHSHNIEINYIARK